MKTIIEMQHYTSGGTECMCFYIGNVSVKLIFCQMSHLSEWRISTDRIWTYRDFLPNLVECKYMDNYESWMFQESLVWDEDVDFFLLVAIQNYAYSIVNQNNVSTFCRGRVPIELEY